MLNKLSVNNKNDPTAQYNLRLNHLPVRKFTRNYTSSPVHIEHPLPEKVDTFDIFTQPKGHNLWTKIG